MMISRVKKRPSANFIFPRKNILKFILFFLFIAGCFYSADEFKKLMHFPIKQVKIFGVHHSNHSEMQAAVEPLVKKGFFGVEVEQIKDKLQDSPWIAKAYVKRVWPDQVLITLEEREPLAKWNDSSLLSTKGELFTPNMNEISGAIPQLFGPEGEQVHLMQIYGKVNNLIAPLHFKISRLELTPALTFSLMFDNGIKVSAGYKDVLTHISHFVKVYSKIVGDRAADVDYVDLRYPNGLAVRWKSIT